MRKMMVFSPAELTKKAKAEDLIVLLLHKAKAVASCFGIASL